MSLDINEMRAIVEAAKKRGVIREPGAEPFAAAAPEPSALPGGGAVLPDWLKGELDRPSAGDRPSSPSWRSE